MAKSRELAAKAAALSPDGAAGKAALAGHRALLEENYAEAARLFEQALARDPNDAATHAQYAVTCLLQLGRLEDARREARKASELDPRNGLAAYALVQTDYCARDYRTAVAHAHEALERLPDSLLIPLLLIDSYLAVGSFDEAWFFIEKTGVDMDAYRALIRASKGQRDEALRAGRERASTGWAPLLAARLFAVGGDAPSAQHWLEEADRRHDFGARIAARYAPDFDVLRSSSQFASLLTSMSSPRRE